jgi:hypothetical protein
MALASSNLFDCRASSHRCWSFFHIFLDNALVGLFWLYVKQVKRRICIEREDGQRRVRYYCSRAIRNRASLQNPCEIDPRRAHTAHCPSKAVLSYRFSIGQDSCRKNYQILFTSFLMLVKRMTIAEWTPYCQRKLLNSRLSQNDLFRPSVII